MRRFLDDKLGKMGCQHCASGRLETQIICPSLFRATNRPTPRTTRRIVQVGIVYSRTILQRTMRGTLPGGVSSTPEGPHCAVATACEVSRQVIARCSGSLFPGGGGWMPYSIKSGFPWTEACEQHRPRHGCGWFRRYRIAVGNCAGPWPSGGNRWDFPIPTASFSGPAAKDATKGKASTSWPRWLGCRLRSCVAWSIVWHGAVGWSAAVRHTTAAGSIGD